MGLIEMIVLLFRSVLVAYGDRDKHVDRAE